MLNCDNSGEVQQKGIELALAENDLDFVMYHSSDPTYATNCAKIITSLDYDKCKKYIGDLFTWIESFNNVGAEDIYDYLKKAPYEIIADELMEAKIFATRKNNEDALSILLLLEKERRFLETGDGSLSPTP